MLSVHRIKKALNPVHNTVPEDDFRILESWTETDDNVDARKAKMKYFCYKIASIDPETGKKNILYKAIKFARIDRLPKSARQSTSFMDMQTQVLSSVYEQGYNLITLIANVIRPTAEGLMYLYGVQGVSDDLDEAKRRADSDFLGFVGSMLGTFRVLQLHTITAEEGAWLAEKMRAMKYMTAVRGIPKANTAGEDMGNKGIGGTNLNPDSQGTLEEIITAMADYEYVIEILSTPVYQRTLMAWNAQTQKQMTEWYGQLQGTKSLNFNLSIPMTYMTSTGNSQGWSKNYTDSNTVSYTHGESYTKGYSGFSCKLFCGNCRKMLEADSRTLSINGQKKRYKIWCCRKCPGQREFDDVIRKATQSLFNEPQCEGLFAQNIEKAIIYNDRIDFYFKEGKVITWEKE